MSLQKENKTKEVKAGFALETEAAVWLVLLLMIISALGGAAVMGMILLDKIERTGRDQGGRRK